MRQFLLLVFAVCASCPALAEETVRIGSISIRPLDVYSEAEADRGALYRLADSLHMETHSSVIRKMLLFNVGDVYRPERLAETERNLRKLHFIKSAVVEASPPHDGVVDVTVTTQDSWTIAPETQLGMKGGSSTYGAAITDTNLLGRGKQLSLGWEKGLDRTRYGIYFEDPIINASKWRSELAYGFNSDGYDRRFSLRRPFYSFATPWSAELSYQAFEQDDRTWAGGGVEENRFRQKHRVMTAAFGRAFEPNDATASRVTAGLRLVRDDLTPIPGVTVRAVNDQRDYRYLFARYEHAHNDFIKVNFVNSDLRFEDFNLGRQVITEAAISPRVFGTGRTTTLGRVSLAQGAKLAESSFLLPVIGAESRFDGGARNTIAFASAMYVFRHDTDHPATTLARVSVANGWRLDPEVQFFADGANGLRGYRIHSLVGSRSIVANFEHRMYLGREILQLISPGVVAFADAGNATYGGFRQLMHLKSDVGIGLRIGLPRTPKNLLRIDLAYALSADPLGRKGLLVSFSSGQAF